MTRQTPELTGTWALSQMCPVAARWRKKAARGKTERGSEIRPTMPLQSAPRTMTTRSLSASRARQAVPKQRPQLPRHLRTCNCRSCRPGARHFPPVLAQPPRPASTPCLYQRKQHMQKRRRLHHRPQRLLNRQDPTVHSPSRVPQPSPRFRQGRVRPLASLRLSHRSKRQ